MQNDELAEAKTYVSKYTDSLRDSLAVVDEKSMINATLEAVEENLEEIISTGIPIAFDGTWQQRGFVSKNAGLPL